MENKKISDKIVDFVFSNDYRKYLILLIILGGILRYLLVNNISFLGDEMVHGPHAINFLGTNKIGIMQQSVLWFYLTDIAYKIFGVTAFSARFLSFFFGILIIPATYLLGKELYNKKTGIISAFLVTISAYSIRYTLIEMDLSMVFFVLLATLFFIKGLKKDKLSYEAAIFLGVATLIKSIALFFVVGFGVAYFYHKYKKIENKKELLTKKDWKEGITFTSIIFLIYSPLLIYNFLLYKYKGVVDVIFAKFFDINREIYAGQLGFDEPFSFVNVFLGAFEMIKTGFLTLDPIIFLLSLLGITWALKEKKYIYKRIILITIIVGFLLLTGSALLQTHYVSFIPFLSIFASSAIIKIEKKFKDKQKNILPIILGIILIANIFFIPIGSPLISHLTSTSANIKMREYAINNIGENDVVIVDSRLYRGRIAWIFNDKYYLESAYLNQYNEVLNNFGGMDLSTNLYYIECARDDCGWGTITQGPLNQSSEQITNLFKQNTQLIETFKGGGGYDEITGVPYLRVYKTQTVVKQGIYEYIQSTHDWFYYPLRYQREAYDDYDPKGIFDNILDFVGHIILWFAILISILTPFYLIYLLYKEK